MIEVCFCEKAHFYFTPPPILVFNKWWVEELVRLWLKAIVFDEGFVIHFRICKIDFKNL